MCRTVRNRVSEFLFEFSAIPTKLAVVYTDSFAIGLAVLGQTLGHSAQSANVSAQYSSLSQGLFLSAPSV